MKNPRLSMQILSDLCSETLKINDTRIEDFSLILFTRETIFEILFHKTFHESTNLPLENTKKKYPFSKRGIKIFIAPNLNPRNITFTLQNTRDITWKTSKDASINRKHEVQILSEIHKSQDSFYTPDFLSLIPRVLFRRPSSPRRD